MELKETQLMLSESKFTNTILVPYTIKGYHFQIFEEKFFAVSVSKNWRGYEIDSDPCGSGSTIYR
jgi:hypothetical protein